jgi:hypothetical protein
MMRSRMAVTRLGRVAGAMVLAMAVLTAAASAITAAA